MSGSGCDYARIVVITADIRSIIDEPSKINEWARVVGEEVREQKPAFTAIHVQGATVQGKGDKEAVERLMQEIDARPGFDWFQSSRHFHDVDGSGLSCLYYARDEARPALFHYQKNEYRSAGGHENADSSNIKREKLPDFGVKLPSSDSASPSYALTRWLLFDKPFNFVNLSLSGDAFPLEGCHKHPSDSALNRLRQLENVMNSLQSHNLWDDDATFIAGKFNTSLNKFKLLEDQAKTNQASLIDKLDDTTSPRLEAAGLSGKRIFHVSDKKFDLLDLHDWMFNTCNGQLVRKYDQELADLKNSGQVHEPKIYFSPNSTYGFDRKTSKDFFVRSQCPAWKNRVFVNAKAWQMMHKDSFSGSGLYYGLVGSNTDIGDSKPVSLIATICLKQ